MRIQIQEYLLPSHWASALINGDYSGYDPEDIANINAFTDSMVREHGKCWCVGVGDDTQFTRYHDASDIMPLAADCVEFQFDVTGRP